MTQPFSLPIEYVHHQTLSPLYDSDLELSCIKEYNHDGKSLFETIYEPKHVMDRLHSQKAMTIYTNDISFLEDTQILIRKVLSNVEPVDILVSHKAYSEFEAINKEDDFHSKYQYIDLERLRGFNHNANLMQMLSLYNLTSPIITLITPIIVLILPFFLIRWQGVALSMNTYIDIVKRLVKNHALGRIATTFNQVSWEKRVYLLATTGFYLFQIYQSALSCYRFATNMKHIHYVLDIYNLYVSQSCKRLHSLLRSDAKNLPSYKPFLDVLQHQYNNLSSLSSQLESVKPLSLSVTKACQIGQIMKLYYGLKYDKTINETLLYSFHFNCYINRMVKLQSFGLTKAKFSHKPGWKITNMIYPHAINDSSVSNSLSLKRPILLTGPNASGKTTLLKSAFINTLMAQQHGVGPFKAFTFKPYDYFHCYLDIPDTSGRDSLFQAEARRCLDIVKAVTDNTAPEVRHFCIFDEIYSGTNPTEAVASAFAFIKTLSKQRNCTFILTTHFYNLCELSSLKKLNISNMQMGFKLNETHPVYTYKVKPGVSNLKGGIAVLKELDYPIKLIEDAKTILKEYV